jgi:hypothetical protein
VHPLPPMPRHHSCHFDRGGLPISCTCSRQLPIRHPPLSFRPEWADASSHLRSREGVGPRSGEISLRFDRGGLCSPNATITTQSLKCRKFALYSALNMPILSIPNSCSICACLAKQLSLLSTTYSLFLRALCHFSHLQSFVFNLLWTLLRKIPGVGGMGSQKTRSVQRQVNARRLAASPRAPWPHSRRSVRQCTPTETRSTAGSPSCP